MRGGAEWAAVLGPGKGTAALQQQQELRDCRKSCPLAVSCDGGVRPSGTPDDGGGVKRRILVGLGGSANLPPISAPCR